MRLRSAMRYLSIGCNCLIRLVAGAWFCVSLFLSVTVLLEMES